LNRAQITQIVSAPSLVRGARGRVLSIARAEAFPLAVLLFAVFAVYLPTLDDYFHGDDFLAFIDLTTAPPLQQIGDVFTFNDTNVYWRPLGHLYFLAIYETAGLDPFAFHLGSMVLFLLTLVLLYWFVVRFGLGRGVALGAVLVFALLPNHVVSVAWTTNAPRLLAVLFALACLLLVQESMRTGRRRFEVLAFLAMVAAVLSDEVVVALTPLPVLYAWLAQPELRLLSRPNFLRGAVYGGFGLAITVLQLTVGMQGQPAPAVISLNEIGFGWHIPRELWALSAKLALPVTDGIGLESIVIAQWVVGAIAFILAAVLLAIGSNRVRVLILWTALSLAPFTLWTAPIAPARYTYMAAIPFAILLCWSAAAIASAIGRSSAFERLRGWNLALAPVAVGAAAVLALALLSAYETRQRNETFAAAAEPYEVLAEGLPRALPKVASNSRLIIYYGVWDGAFVWQDAVVQTIYRDRTLRTLNVGRAGSESDALPVLKNDVVVFYTERGFIVPTQNR
jgi:hypothetical protein